MCASMHDFLHYSVNLLFRRTNQFQFAIQMDEPKAAYILSAFERKPCDCKIISVSPPISFLDVAASGALHLILVYWFGTLLWDSR